MNLTTVSNGEAYENRSQKNLLKRLPKPPEKINSPVDFKISHALKRY
ncbi:MAG: hypothetical protein QW146_08775 [Candidatus Bathyarchaeia archaeon]